MNITLVRRLAAAVLAAGALAPSQAAIYSGSWDPPYGDPFNNLGWRGGIQVDAPTNCGASSGFTGIVTCAPGAATIDYAFVELYLLTGPNAGNTFDTLTFAPPAPASFTVNKLELDNGALTGLVTGRSNWIYDSVFDVDFALQFSVDGLLATRLPGRITVPTDYTGPILIFRDKVCIEEHHRRGDYDHDDDCDDYKFAYGTNNLTNAANRPVVTFTQVPEPGSPTLVLAGLLAMTAVVRRRRATPRG